MEKLKAYFFKTRIIWTLGFIFINYFICTGQGNCLIYPEESGERRACEMSYRAIEYPQGSRESQIVFDSAISIGPQYAYAYYQKSVPYFKRGLLTEGVSILNKAIEIEPLSYLSYRAYWYFTHHSYEQCVKDLEEYYGLRNAYQQHTPGGDMDMKMVLAVSYAHMNDLPKSLRTAQDCLNSYTSDDYFGDLDHYIIGVLHYKNQEYEEAAEAFKRQITKSEKFADAYYYLGLVKNAQLKLEEAQDLFKKSLELLKTARYRNSMYFPIKETDILVEIRE